jgi:hypothetical protein
MEHTTISPPLCSKHGCEKVWHKNRSIKAGGYWACRPCENKWPADQTERIWAKDKPAPTCQKCGHKKVKLKYQCRGTWKCQRCRNEAARNRRKANPKKVRAKARGWRKANPESECAQQHNRLALKRGMASPLCTVTAAVIAERFALTDGCAYCGADAKKTLDHVVAPKRRRLHVPSNLVGACSRCNSSKQDSPVEAWFKAQPFFSEQRWQRIQKITGQGQLSLI